MPYKGAALHFFWHMRNVGLLSPKLVNITSSWAKTEVQKLSYLQLSFSEHVFSCSKPTLRSKIIIFSTCSFDEKIVTFSMFKTFPRPQVHLEYFLAVFVGQKQVSVKQVAAGNPCSRQPKAVTAAEYWLSQTALEMCCNLKLQHPSREGFGFSVLCPFPFS